MCYCYAIRYILIWASLHYLLSYYVCTGPPRARAPGVAPDMGETSECGS